MRIGVFGGSFDPVHEGHLNLADCARREFSLDRMIWLPALKAPHKDIPAAPFGDRVAMLRLALQGMPGSEVSDLEGSLPQPSYTVRSLGRLKDRWGRGHAWFLLIGADNWSIFTSWHQWERLLREAELIIYPRAGHAPSDLPPRVHRLEAPMVETSSSAIRRSIAQTGDCPEPGMPPAVRDYIREHGLYRSKESRA